MFDGPVVPLALRLSLPILASNLLQFLYAAVDTWWISRLDPSSTALLAGTGTMFPVFFVIMATGGSVAVGVSALVGRAIGEQNRDIEKHVMPSALALVIGLVIPVLVAGYGWGPGLVRMLAGDKLTPEAMGYGLVYFRTLLPGMALMLLGNAFVGVLQGEGRMPALARAAVLSTVTNMVLDPVCMFWLRMGVAGAGIATSISVVVASVYVVVLFAQGKTQTPLSADPRRVSAATAWEIVRVGFPQFLSMASLAWLAGLDSPNWAAVAVAPFGSISAGDILASWAAHDLLHLRQLIELHWAYQRQQVAPYEVRYAGDW